MRSARNAVLVAVLIFSLFILLTDYKKAEADILELTGQDWNFIGNWIIMAFMFWFITILFRAAYLVVIGIEAIYYKLFNYLNPKKDGTT